MAWSNPNETEESTSNLNHIYFFVNQVNEAHSEKDSSVATSNGSAPVRSRTSSPGSNDTGFESAATTSTSNSELNPGAKEFKPSVKHSTTSLELKVGKLYELRQTTDKGLGLFATSFIKLGTLVFSEEPLLKISHNALHQVWGPFCRLSKAQKEAYDNLHAFNPPDLALEEAAKRYLIDRNDDSLDQDDIDELIAEQVRVMSTFAVNNFEFPPAGLAVYTTASRLNHSCVPNVHHSYNPTLKKLTVHAVRDIHPGEELCTTYLGGHGAYQHRNQRNTKLLSAYGFLCRCPACSDSTGASDARRELMRGLSWGLNQFDQANTTVTLNSNPYVPTTGSAALHQAETLITTMLQEGILAVELTKAYRMASMQALQLRDYELALEYAANEAEVERNCAGVELEDLRRVGAASACWVERVWEVVRGEGVAREGEGGLGGWHESKRKRKNERRKERKKEKKRVEAAMVADEGRENGIGLMV